MNVIITRHSSGGFIGRPEQSNQIRSSFDIQILIDQIKSDGNTPVIESDTAKYLDKYCIQYII